MQTPFQILQNEKRLRKKKTFTNNEQRSFQLGYKIPNPLQKRTFSENNKNNNNKNKSLINKNEYSSNNSPKNCQKKYQIIFRQSIRKFNVYRNNIYHNHNALKNGNFIKKFISSKPGYQSQRNVIQFKDESPEKKMNKLLERNQLNPQKKHINLNENEFKVNQPMINKFNNDKKLYLKIPQFCIQKCRILTFNNDNQNKLNGQSSKNKTAFYKIRAKFRSQDYQKNNKSRINTTQAFFRQKSKKFLQSEVLTSPKKSQNQNQDYFFHLKSKQIITDQIFMINNPVGQLDVNKVANFIKIKKKKKFPYFDSQKRMKLQDFSQFKRTITDNTTDKTNKNILLEKIQKGYFSPNKKRRPNLNIKINQLQDNIAGWQIKNPQNEQILNIGKCNFLED